LELKLNKSGSVRANFFYRQNIDYISGNVPGSIVPRRYGASIGYGKEFNTLDELFGKKKKKLPKNATEKSESDSTGTHLP
ncbi:MAG: hypothetical protein ACJ75F_09410, partial [Flavisolibacter sp.]